MTLAISRDGTKLRVGRRYFELYPGQGRDGVMLCEGDTRPNGQIPFAHVRHMRTAEFPRNLEVILEPDRTEYGEVAYMSISRRGERIRFDLDCDYCFNEWTEPVNLRDFVATMVREAKKLKAFKIERIIEQRAYDDMLSVRLTAEFDIGGRLHDLYRALMRGLKSAHEEALARVARAASAKMLARLSMQTQLPPAARKQPPRAFICHDSRDKSKVAEPIAQRLAALTCPVWYDKFSLQVGDRLRESIEAGLKQAGKCILIISPRFLSNQGWSKIELDSIFSRELMERKDILLPVWVGVTPRQVFEYSPALANRVGINWSLGLNEVVRQLYAATSRRSRK